MQLMTVGNAAEQTGLSAKAIRLYERKGLLAEAERTQAGYRLFTTDDVAILHFIRRAKALDLGLDEIKDILDLQRGGEQPCQLVTSMLDTHLADIDQKLADLRTLRDSLRTARRAAATARRDGNTVIICHIIETPPEAPPPEQPGTGTHPNEPSSRGQSRRTPESTQRPGTISPIRPRPSAVQVEASSALY